MDRFKYFIKACFIYLFNVLKERCLRLSGDGYINEIRAASDFYTTCIPILHARTVLITYFIIIKYISVIPLSVVICEYKFAFIENGKHIFILALGFYFHLTF